MEGHNDHNYASPIGSAKLSKTCTVNTKELKRLKNQQYRQKKTLEKLSLWNKNHILKETNTEYKVSTLFLTQLIIQCQCHCADMNSNVRYGIFQKTKVFFPSGEVQIGVVTTQTKTRASRISSVSITDQMKRGIKNQRDRDYRQRIKMEKDKLDKGNQILEKENQELHEFNIHLFDTVLTKCACNRYA